MTSAKVDVLEERIKNMLCENTKEHKSILDEIEAINKKLDETFVTRAEFGPIQKIVYGMVGIVLTAAIVALLRLVITSGVV